MTGHAAPTPPGAGRRRQRTGSLALGDRVSGLWTAGLLLLMLPCAVLAQASPPVPAPPVPAPPTCPPRVAASIAVDVADPEPRILPTRRASDLSAEIGGSSGGEFPHHLGVTASRVDWHAEITVRGRGPDGGPVCAFPTAIRIRLAHGEHSIRLARELPRGGCLAREVLAHERRHAELNRRTLRHAAEELRHVARAWAARAETTAPDVGAAAVRLQDDLGQAIEPVLERLRQAREAGHALIDTPEEYRRLSHICPTDQRRLRAALQRG